ncbi:MAG: VPGUxxT family thioredoxin-like (seleno)protein, type 2 [Saprospiraceae bacterium]|nr:VPGUxxT family thioredoxin-like (seleno)protein, type 2 [Saprospiraceae bacterium]
MKQFLTLLFLPLALLTGVVFQGEKQAAGATPEQAKTPVLPVQKSPEQPEELGKVRWLRDYDAGKTQAQKSGKPLLLLFQEVPGCANCTRYGNNTLSHPLIVEAIETCFTPVCIYNNKGGKDAEILRRFGEPAWNNPVVRILRPDDERDLVLRMTNFNSSSQLVNGMRRALEWAATPVPPYFELLEEELAAREAGLQTATFSMYCFWNGEAAFGSLPGVIETEPGFQGGKEVVKVQFDPAITSRAELERQTAAQNFQSCAKNEGFRPDRAPKYYLAQTTYRFIPMTSLQAARANSLVGKNRSPEALLSPRQLELHKKIQESPAKNRQNMIGRKDLAQAWEEMEEG